MSGLQSGAQEGPGQQGMWAGDTPSEEQVYAVALWLEKDARQALAP